MGRKATTQQTDPKEGLMLWLISWGGSMEIPPIWQIEAAKLEAEGRVTLGPIKSQGKNVGWRRVEVKR